MGWMTVSVIRGTRQSPPLRRMTIKGFSLPGIGGKRESAVLFPLPVPFISIVTGAVV